MNIALARRNEGAGGGGRFLSVLDADGRSSPGEFRNGRFFFFGHRNDAGSDVTLRQPSQPKHRGRPAIMQARRPVRRPFGENAPNGRG